MVCLCMFHLILMKFSIWSVRWCIQKFPDGVDNEIKINIRCEATQRVMAAKLTILTHKIVTHLHPVAESYDTCSSRSRRPVLELFNTPLYIQLRTCDTAVQFTRLIYCQDPQNLSWCLSNTNAVLFCYTNYDFLPNYAL